LLLKEILGTGTYVAAVPNLATKALLQEWALDSGIQLVDDLHVTLLYSRNSISVSPKKDVDYHATPLKFDTFDGNCLVLVLESEDLQRRHDQFIQAGGTHDFPKYNPHVTLVKGKESLSGLSLPNFALTFCNEYAEVLDDGDF
jgi:hypothetical protein